MPHFKDEKSEAQMGSQDPGSSTDTTGEPLILIKTGIAAPSSVCLSLTARKPLVCSLKGETTLLSARDTAPTHPCFPFLPGFLLLEGESKNLATGEDCEMAYQVKAGAAKPGNLSLGPGRRKEQTLCTFTHVK